MTTAHTPGPWRIAPASAYTSGLNVDAGTRGYVCLVGERGDAEAEANARLIAQAPALLVFAKRYASECAECGGTGRVAILLAGDERACPECVYVRKVITAAEGQS